MACSMGVTGALLPDPGLVLWPIPRPNGKGIGAPIRDLRMADRPLDPDGEGRSDWDLNGVRRGLVLLSIDVSTLSAPLGEPRVVTGLAECEGRHPVLEGVLRLVESLERLRPGGE